MKQNRIQTYIYIYIYIFTKVPRQKWKSFQWIVLDWMNICLEKWTSVLTSHHIPKINSEYVIWSACKPNTIIFLEESIGDLHNLGLGKHFLDGMPKSLTIKEKIKSGTCLKLKMSVPHKIPLKWKGKPWTSRKYNTHQRTFILNF